MMGFQDIFCFTKKRFVFISVVLLTITILYMRGLPLDKEATPKRVSRPTQHLPLKIYAPVSTEIASEFSSEGLEGMVNEDNNFEAYFYGNTSYSQSRTHSDMGDVSSRSSNTSCDVNWMTKSSYLQQLKSISTDCPNIDRRQNIPYYVECDPDLKQYINAVIGRLRTTSSSLWSLVKELNLFQNLTLPAKWKALKDMLNLCGYEQRLPDVINIGVKKSGTSMFQALFIKHPQIVNSLATDVAGEVHFFDRNYHKGIGYYRSRMMFASSEMLSFEKTPKYFRTKDAPSNMVKDLPDHVKFILLVKDPVKRSISEFKHESQLKLKHANFKTRGFQKIRRTEQSEGIRFENEVLRQDGEVNLDSEIIDTSLYAKHFSNWLDYYPRERFLIIDYDKLLQNVSFWLQKVEQFLDLQPFFQHKMFRLNKNRRLCFIPPHGLKSKSVCPGSGSDGSIPKAKPSRDTLLKLCHFFQPYNKMFMHLTNMTFDWRCQDESI
ncbi:heparan sulfate glucosamine 3-O-sulfotransferase 1-like [Amphiura filiformis]|uniref:heparan sulfate glucosamine 3-O-sulfotransferase 1-like n=1 Tax=Amphiura filiformis TaxID=82378 RepID=UPI003B214055